MKSKLQILFFSVLALVSLALWAQDGEAFESFNASADCLECHGFYDDPFDNCSSCHTIFSGGPGSYGHFAHLNIGLPLFCFTCHIDIGDDPPTSKCTICHLKNGLIKHHNIAAEEIPGIAFDETGLCWMCHDEVTPDPEDTMPPGYEGTCLNPCDGSEELFTTGSFTMSLDNDGDLLLDSADPDCFICSENIARVTGAPPVDYSSLQAAFENALDNGTIQINRTPFVEDLSIDLYKTLNIESGYDCYITSISGKSTVEGKVTIGTGALVLKRGALQIQTPIEDCSDSVDNDDDGLADCDDPDCDYKAPCAQTESACNDCVDNDGNGLTDCADASCSDDPACLIDENYCNLCHGDPPIIQTRLLTWVPEPAQ